jgi:hypothetical protein
MTTSLSLKFPEGVALFEHTNEKVLFGAIGTFDSPDFNLVIRPAVVFKQTVSAIFSLSARYKSWHFVSRVLSESDRLGVFFVSPALPQCGLTVSRNETAAYLRAAAPGNGSLSLIVKHQRGPGAVLAEVRADGNYGRLTFGAALEAQWRENLVFGPAIAVAKYALEKSDAEVVFGWRAPGEVSAELRLPSGWVVGSDVRLSIALREASVVGVGIAVVVNG